MAVQYFSLHLYPVLKQMNFICIQFNYNCKKTTIRKPGNKYICFIFLCLSLLFLFYSVLFLVYCPFYRVIPTKDETVKTTKTFLYTTIISKKQILCLAMNMALNSLFIDLACKERSLQLVINIRKQTVYIPFSRLCSLILCG